MYKGIVKENIYTIKDGEICIGEDIGDGESFFKEYNIKLKKLYEKFYTKEAKGIAVKYKEHAQYFCNKLIEQINDTYKSKEMLNKIISE